MAETVELAILFADISGSTRLYEELGDAQARPLIARIMEFMSQLIRRHDGTVVKTIGDEVMATFPSAQKALDASCTIQKEIKENAAGFGVPSLGIRIGFHFGSVIQENQDVFGDAVNVAARVAGLAKRAQILTTKQTLELMTLETSQIRWIDTTRVKGKVQPIEFYEIFYEQERDVTLVGQIITSSTVTISPSQVKLSLQHRGSIIELNAEQPTLTIGRSAQNDLSISNTTVVSRFHARIELRRNRFVLIDQSTNGTFVAEQNTQPIHLRRDEMGLGGSGVISLGQPIASTSERDLIHYRCITE